MKPSCPSTILRKADTPFFLVTNLTNIRFLTGLELSAGVMLLNSRRFKLFVDGRYIEAATKNPMHRTDVLDLENLEKVLEKVGECGFESDHVTVSRLRGWKRKFKNTKFVQKKGIIEFFRRQKSPEELRKFKRAQKITREIMARIPSTLRSGVTEKKIAWQIENWARELGAESLSFEPIVAFGTHSSRPHHHPSDRKLKKGHIVQIDCGARFKGYCADQSRVFFTAQPTSQQQNVYNAVVSAKEEAESMVRAGVTTKELDECAVEVLREFGYDEYFTHSLGHGVGLDIHEDPTLSSRIKPVELLENEIITIEPGVYIPGKFGMRIEDEVIVGK